MAWVTHKPSIKDAALRSPRQLQTGIDFYSVFQVKYCLSFAGVVELADTHGSGPCARKGVKVQVLSPAP